MIMNQSWSGLLSILSAVALATSGCGSAGPNSSASAPSVPPTTAVSMPATAKTEQVGAAGTIKPGQWKGELAGEPVMFRAGAENAITDLSLSVRTFSDPSARCSISVPRATVEAPFTLRVNDESNNTSVSMSITLESETAILAENVVGVCRGGLITFGTWFRASWTNS